MHNDYSQQYINNNTAQSGQKEQTEMSDKNNDASGIMGTMGLGLIILLIFIVVLGMLRGGNGFFGGGNANNSGVLEDVTLSRAVNGYSGGNFSGVDHVREHQGTREHADKGRKHDEIITRLDDAKLELAKQREQDLREKVNEKDRKLDMYEQRSWMQEESERNRRRTQEDFACFINGTNRQLGEIFNRVDRVERDMPHKAPMYATGWIPSGNVFPPIKEECSRV